MNPLSNYTWERALVDISEDDDRSVAIDIGGYRVVGIGAPAALTGTPTINGFRIDPGDGTIRSVVDVGGTAVTMTGAIAASEVQEIPPTVNLRLVGVQFQFDLSVAQAADRVFIVLLEKLPN